MTSKVSSTATNAGRNLVESGSKSAGRVGGSSFDELATVSLVSKSRNAADHGATFAGKSSFVSRNADEGMDYGRQAVAKSPSKSDKSNVVNMSEYKAAKENKLADAVDESANDNVIDFSKHQANRGKTKEENLNFGKSEKTNVQDLDSKQEFNTKITNEKSVEIQTKEPVEMPKAVGAEFDPIDLPKKNNLELVVNNGPVSMKKGSDVVASAGGRMDSAVDCIPSTSGVSRGSSGAGKIPSEGIEEDNLKFTQVTASPNFSIEGKFAGKTIGEVAEQLRNGVLTPNDVPVTYIERNGVKLIENTRSSLALKRAGIPEKDWNLKNLTGDSIIEEKITKRLEKNGLTDEGTDVLRITGAGKTASSLK